MRRRGFLGTMLAGVAAAPSAVLKSAGVAESGIGLGGMAAPVAGLVSSMGVPNSISGSRNWALESLTRLKMLKTIAPSWFEQSRRQQSHNVYVLDVDLASLRSVSPAMKIAIQRERQFQRSIELEERSLSIRAQEIAFGENQ